ncbi:Zeta-crystallin [Drechslerella dactyloides]|uniref:Zeta-crystallin n=1 Tax=Drechslerella dactyloides TaxID=74499 RepID=A0AAD6NJW5_DREDA|nr:Zeta-crystallin [Drechslerella dactyloides]
MKQVIINRDLSANIVDVPIPQPGPHEILIRVVVVGSNPKDWKYPVFWSDQPVPSGDDIGGIVEAVGEGVYELKKGDRVMTYRYYKTPTGGHAEYVIGYDFITAKIPDNISFEAVVGLYKTLHLPLPWSPATKPIPLVVYGAATAVGAFAIKLARLSNIHPIIGVVGRAKDYAETLIDRSKGDDLVDYRDGNDAVVKRIRAALAKNGYQSVDHVFDAVSEHGSVLDSAAVLSKTGRVTGVLPLNQDPKAVSLSKDIDWVLTMVSDVFESQWTEGSEEKKQGVITAPKELGYLFSRWFVRGLAEGWFKAHPYEVVLGGLNGVEGALKDLKAGKASAVKYVFRVADTK